MMQPFSIAIDGPAGAGKSSVAKIVAQRLDAMYLDTGAMYRAIGLFYLRRRQLDQIDAIAETVRDVDISVRFLEGAQHVFLGAEDVSEIIRTPEGSLAASAVSAIREVRLYMVELQRRIASNISVVMDGRDIGTVVLPNATLKVYLTANAQIRAERRYAELRAKGEMPKFHEVLDDIVLRDYNDSHRAESPLCRAEDAHLLDTSNLTLNQAADALEALFHAAIERLQSSDQGGIAQ